ncbi:MAG: hypothetical protein V4568_18005 [Pseudomonadota bacterium]
MLLKEDLEKRVTQIQAEVEQSAGRHNMLVGHLNEAKALLDICNAPAVEPEASAEEIEKKEAEGMDHAP